MHLRNSQSFFLLACLSLNVWTRPGSEQEPISKGTQEPGSSQSTPSPTQPQESQQVGTAEGGFVIRKQVQEVVIHATVMDKNKRLVTTLDRGAFKVFEDGKPQTITSFRHEDTPVALGIVIDNSGSMREKREKVNRATLNLVRASNRQDEVFVVNFNDVYYLDQDFTSDIGKLKEALEKIESRGGTALYDALVASADQLTHSQLQKKILFAVTDGEDTASSQSLEKAVERLQGENGPAVYAVGVLGDDKPRRARRALETIAERTGGIAFLPKTADEVDEISGTVAHDIRNQYTIGYKPSNPLTDGGFRRIKVEALASGYKDLKVRTRSGYYAGVDGTAR
jgi:Ca-activated chloride channel family protein